MKVGKSEEFIPLTHIFKSRNGKFMFCPLLYILLFKYGDENHVDRFVDMAFCLKRGSLLHMTFSENFFYILLNILSPFFEATETSIHVLLAVSAVFLW